MTLTVEFDPASWSERLRGAFRERWDCEYCKTSNKDAVDHCNHCGAPRRTPEPPKPQTPFQQICEPEPEEKPQTFLKKLRRFLSDLTDGLGGGMESF